MEGVGFGWINAPWRAGRYRADRFYAERGAKYEAFVGSGGCGHVGAIPAAAAPPETVTIVEKDVTDAFVDSFTCEFAEEFEITTTFNHIEHVTAFPDGRGTFHVHRHRNV